MNESSQSNGNGNGSTEATAYLAAIVESSDDAIISKNLKGVVTSWNAAAEHIFGFTAQEAIGKPISSLIMPPDRMEEESSIIASIAQGKKVDHFQTVRITKSGKLVDVSVSVSPIRNNKGDIIGASNITRDISVIKAAERASAYLAAIVTSSDDAIISKNLDGIIASWNSAAEKMYGYTAKEVVGQSIYLIIPKDREEEEKKIIERLRRGEKINHFETIRRAKDDKLIPVSLTISPILDSKGKIIGASKVARDISERKRYEAELNTQRQWFEVTLGSIGDAVIATDEKLKVNYLNTVAEKLTGWTHREALGKPIDEIFKIINEDSRNPVEHPLHDVMRTGTIHGLANHTVLIAKDGTEYSIEDAAAPIRLPDGQLIGAVLVFHDIGDRRVLEKELKQKADTLTEKDRRKDEFLAMLAHELRNPLAPVSNAIHIALKKAVDEQTKQEALTMASEQISHMVRLLDDLLDVSRITHGKISLHTECIDICQAIRQAMDSANPHISQHGHTLQTRIVACPVWVMGDATRLSQLFGNLLNNAAKYTKDGGVINLDVEERGKEVVVRIKDNGIGIPPAQLPYIFDMFTQADNSMERAHGGLGIGLTLVKNIAELHGGTVEAQSEGKGKGTEFTVRLPMIEKGQRPKEMKIDPPQEQSAIYRILVVDDNEASAKTLGWMMEAMGHQVKMAYSAKAALASIGDFKPNVVLLDIGMPDMNGYELCGEMRRIPELKNATYIAQTGWGQEQHLQRSKDAGFDFHLTKPISFEDLQKQLESIKKAA
jgi:PAS domain S-box-containing protein